MSCKTEVSSANRNICNFYKILQSKCSLFAADRCKTVGTKQDILSEFKILM